ncbi:DUF2177 family protein [uncultured Tateyamaria sp.]|uniref:DUF2177 family protein n=1 Tax=uncultured Tateyamaria sp. TaxID=455651 RepID=UPI003436FE5E
MAGQLSREPWLDWDGRVTEVVALDLISLQCTQRKQNAQRRKDSLLRKFPETPILRFLLKTALGCHMKKPPCITIRKHSISCGAIRGAILGFATYAMFDFGVYSHFDGISLSFVAVNLTWGTLVSAVCATVAVSIALALHPREQPA